MVISQIYSYNYKKLSLTFLTLPSRLRDACVQARCEYFFARMARIFASQKTEILVYLRVRKMRTSLTSVRDSNGAVRRCAATERFCAEPWIARPRLAGERPLFLLKFTSSFFKKFTLSLIVYL